MKEDDVLVGITLGTLGAIGVAGLTTPIPPPSPPHQPAITKPLIGITWGGGRGDTVRIADKNSFFVKPFGLEFSIEGQKFLGLSDSGMTGNTKVMLNRETAEKVGIQKFHKSKKTQHVNFIESGKSQFPIYEDVPLSVAGVPSSVVVDVTVGRNNLINPAVFLPKKDISFWSDSRRNFVTFLPKNSPLLQRGASIPYLRGNETFFNWNIAGHNVPFLIDSGGEMSMINAKLAHQIGLVRYPKIVEWDKAEDRFQTGYLVPVSLPGTAVSFLSEIHIKKNIPIISGPELLEAGWGFTLSDKYMSFFKT